MRAEFPCKAHRAARLVDVSEEYEISRGGHVGKLFKKVSNRSPGKLRRQRRRFDVFGPVDALANQRHRLVATTKRHERYVFQRGCSCQEIAVTRQNLPRLQWLPRPRQVDV